MSGEAMEGNDAMCRICLRRLSPSGAGANMPRHKPLATWSGQRRDDGYCYGSFQKGLLARTPTPEPPR